MKIEKHHTSILFLIGFMVIVLLRTMKCYSINKKIIILQNRTSEEQDLYESFKTENFTNEVVNQRFNIFKKNIQSKLCNPKTSLTDKTKVINSMGAHFKKLKPSNPDEGNPKLTDYITFNKYNEGIKLLDKFDNLLKNEDAINEQCNTWNKNELKESFIEDELSTGEINYKKTEIVEDTLNELNKGSTSNLGKAEKFRQRNRILRNRILRRRITNTKKAKSNYGRNPTSESPQIRTNILCTGININEKRVTIDNLMPEFYILKDHMKNLIMANQTYEKAFIK